MIVLRSHMFSAKFTYYNSFLKKVITTTEIFIVVYNPLLQKFAVTWQTNFVVNKNLLQ